MQKTRELKGNERQKTILIAIPNKGRLSAPAEQLLQKAGISLLSSERKYFCGTTDEKITILRARAKDIPFYVEEGIADFGITGRDIMQERMSEAEIFAELPFGKCRMVLAASSERKKEEIGKIATEFPNMAKKYALQKGMDAEIIKLSGAVDCFKLLGVADAIVDLTVTGKTLEENGLVEIEEIMRSSAVLIGNGRSKSCREIIERIAGNQ